MNVSNISERGENIVAIIEPSPFDSAFEEKVHVCGHVSGMGGAVVWIMIVIHALRTAQKFPQAFLTEIEFVHQVVRVDHLPTHALQRRTFRHEAVYVQNVKIPLRQPVLPLFIGIVCNHTYARLTKRGCTILDGRKPKPSTNGWKMT